MKSSRAGALALLVALPTILLAVGWLHASFREREMRRRELSTSMARTAELVRGVVDASLDELRAHEDQRPFYLYNYYYSPEDVLALTDPVAVSPLAEAPGDPRVVGYFQAEPGPIVRTPHAEEGRTSELDQRVLAVVRAPPFERLFTWITGSPAPESPLLAAVRAPAAPLAEEVEPPVTRPPLARRTPRPRVAVRDSNDPLPEMIRPEGPLTVSLNQWSQNVANDIQQAQAGSQEASSRVVNRGRAAPMTQRNTVDWTTNAAPPQQSAAEVLPPRRNWLPRPRPVEAPPSLPSPPRVPVAQTRAEVDYTPMSLVTFGDELAFVRRVSHAGTTVVQGALLDGAYLRTRFVPEIVGRQTSAIPPTVVPTGTGSCAVREPVSRYVSGVELCFEAAAVTAALTSVDAAWPLQSGLLALLLVLVGFGVVVVQRAGKRADELAQRKSEFVAAVSHELRTPLTTLRMHAEMLESGLVVEEKRQKFYADLVHESVRLSRLVDNVLEVSRIDEGKRPLRAEEGDLRAHLATVVESQRRFVEAKGFSIAMREGSPVVLAFDAQALEQMVVNLLDNAVKYGAGRERAIEVELHAGEDGVTIVVADRGPGVAPALRERVFERFFRGDHEKNRHTPGTGLGLALVRDLAKAHGGDARLSPRPGGGAQVEVSIPWSRKH